MLRQCEFNGRKDILHFKLLQAVINENNNNKAPDKNMENIHEKLTDSHDYFHNHRGLNGDCNQVGSGDRNNFIGGEDGNHDRKGKKKVSSVESRSKRKHENSFIPMECHSKRKHGNSYNPKIRSSSMASSSGLNSVLPLSGNKKLQKNTQNLIRH